MVVPSLYISISVASLWQKSQSYWNWPFKSQIPILSQNLEFYKHITHVVYCSKDLCMGCFFLNPCNSLLCKTTNLRESCCPFATGRWVLPHYLLVTRSDRLWRTPRGGTAAGLSRSSINRKRGKYKIRNFYCDRYTIRNCDEIISTAWTIHVFLILDLHQLS